MRIAVALATLAVGCAHVESGRYGGWDAIKTDGIVLYTDTQTEHGPTLEWLRLSYAAFQGSFFKGVTPTPVEVMYLQNGSPFRTRTGGNRPWATIAPLPDSNAVAGRGLVVVGPWSVLGAPPLVAEPCSTCDPASLSAFRPSDYNPLFPGSTELVPGSILQEPTQYPPNASERPSFRTLPALRAGAMRIAHQMAHHFIEAAVPHAPPWFEEGFAQYLSFVYLLQHGDTTIACFGHPQAAMSASVVSIPVRDLFAYEWRRFNDEGDDHWFMFTSRAFIDYLLHGEDGKLRHRFGRFMHGLAEGKGGAEAFAAAYPDLSIDTVDQRLNAHVRTHRPPAELCPVGFAIARPRNTQPARIPVGANEVRVLFERLEQVPFKEGNADFYPVDLISGSSSDPHARS